MTNIDGYIELVQVITADSALRKAVTIAKKLTEGSNTDISDQADLTEALQKAVEEYEKIEHAINANFAN